MQRSLSNPISISAAVFLLFASTMTCAAETTDQSGRSLAARTRVFQPGENVPYELQAALINAVPGDVIELSAGVFDFETELNIVCDNLTIRGAGRDRTILSFRGQVAGSSGIVATGNGFVIENLAVEDTVGNAIKVLGARDVTFRNVRVEWTAGPKSTNGAYGIYPVECQNVLIKDCVSIGASDAGIYVGQSQDVIVSGCYARQNVAGIEIENTLRADVFDNIAVDNTGGILVFDLPGLKLTNGGHVRVFRNKVSGNNHQNFAPQGTMVADVPSGTGVMLMATDNVEIFDNDIANNQTSNIIVVSFLITERRINDQSYDPFPEACSIHDNRISGGGTIPSGKIGTMLSPLMGGQLPDILFDGLLNAAKLKDGKLPAELRMRIRDNGDATFANVNIGDLSPTNIVTGKYKIERDLEPYGADLAPIKPVQLQAHAKPSPNGNPAVAVYRAAPEKLSGWGLLDKTNDRWVPAARLISYDLNTPLFSDYAVKHRYIRLPQGQQIGWHETEALEFPVGTVIAKTFAYPVAAADRSAEERFLETRIQVHERSGWYGYSYIWDEDQSDATLRLGGGVINVSWKGQDGSLYQNKYQVPNANQCLSCHSRDGRFVPLGPTARNLNGPGRQHGVANQLVDWVKRGVLKGAPTVDQRPVLAVFDDPNSGSLDHRARAWLEVNCAHCHNPKGSARTSGLDLTTTQQDPGRYGVFKSPVAVGKGAGGRRYDIVPGKPDESILMFRMESEEPGARMPNLGRNLVHEESNSLIREWILGMSEHQSTESD